MQVKSTYLRSRHGYSAGASHPGATRTPDSSLAVYEAFSHTGPNNIANRVLLVNGLCHLHRAPSGELESSVTSLDRPCGRLRRARSSHSMDSAHANMQAAADRGTCEAASQFAHQPRHVGIGRSACMHAMRSGARGECRLLHSKCGDDKPARLSIIHRGHFSHRQNTGEGEVR